MERPVHIEVRQVERHDPVGWQSNQQIFQLLVVTRGECSEEPNGVGRPGYDPRGEAGVIEISDQSLEILVELTRDDRRLEQREHGVHDAVVPRVGMAIR